MPFQWWKARAVETAVALFIVSAVISLSGTIADRQKELMPASAWLTINEIYVPDFEQGTNPNIIYDRVIHENFDGFWIVEVQKQTTNGLWATECSGNGVNEYDPEEVIPDNTVSWDWFINRKCRVEPGKYRLKMTINMTRPNWPDKRLFSLSNQFYVLTGEQARMRQTGPCPLCGRESHP